MSARRTSSAPTAAVVRGGCDPLTIESWLAGGEDWAPQYFLGHLSPDEATEAQARCPENRPCLYEP